jgi:mannosylglycoprotein endo-beta-mannosidase
MREPPSRTHDFSWSDLHMPSTDLSSLDRPFTEEEIWQEICQMPQNKAPIPDDFTGHFFRKCWQIIRHDIVAVINSFYCLRCNELNLLNKANIILLPKKEGAEDIRDFRPISLIHVTVKIFTKVLAL